jgi:hypothetical protein
MLSRLLWIGIAGAALIAGIALQDGNSMFGWSHNSHVSAKTDRSIDARVERAIEGSFDKMQVVGSDGREVDVPAETKRALANAVGRLLKAEADMAIARVGDDDEEAMREASARRDQARREVDRLKAEIKGYERAAQGENGALHEQIRREIREDVRDTVRETVRS